MQITQVQIQIKVAKSMKSLFGHMMRRLGPRSPAGGCYMNPATAGCCVNPSEVYDDPWGGCWTCLTAIVHGPHHDVLDRPWGGDIHWSDHIPPHGADWAGGDLSCVVGPSFDAADRFCIGVKVWNEIQDFERVYQVIFYFYVILGL
jgi:hypothetical protein